MIKNLFGRIKGLIPKKIRFFIVRRLLIYPRLKKVKPYHFYSIKPIGSDWGKRGTPVDRYYIEKFLRENSDKIKGRVLEIGDNFYTIKYGGDKVTLSEILHASEDNSKATYIGDLANIPSIESDIFDCIICTQTLQLIPDIDKAINTLYRILKKEGTLLATVPGICKIYQDLNKGWFDYWRFTKNSATWLFNKKFSPVNVEVESYGNVFSSVAFLHNLALEEVNREDLDYHDEEYQMLICIKSVK